MTVISLFNCLCDRNETLGKIPKDPFTNVMKDQFVKNYI